MNIALVLSGGTGSRVGAEIPKQYIRVNNRMIIDYCIETLVDHSMIDAVHIVSDEVWRERILEEFIKQDISLKKLKGFSIPGENRQLSILNGLKEISSYASGEDYILIHDAARPLLTGKQITDCLEAVLGHDGIMPVIPMKDTVYLSSANGEKVSKLLDRKLIVAGQAPEIFRLDKYYEANLKLLKNEIINVNGSTEPAILANMDIKMIPGDEKNFKITTKADLDYFCRIMEEQ